MILFARVANYPILCWRHPLTGYQAEKLTQAEENLLYATHFALCGFFIPQMPCFTIDNVSVQIGHFNGAQALMHSLCFDPREDMALLQKKIDNASSGEIVMLEYPPLSVNVELVNADPSKYTQQDTLCPGKLVVPVMEHSRSRVEAVKSWELIRRCETSSPIKEIRYRSIGLELGFAITFDKTQSKGFSKLILDLNSWPKAHLAFEKVLVGLSRVGMLDDIRLFPLLPKQTLSHLWKLQPDQDMLVWLRSYNQDGKFSADLAADAYKQRPKKKPRASSNNQPATANEQNQHQNKRPSRPRNDAAAKSRSMSVPSKKNEDISTGTQRKPRSASISSGTESRKRNIIKTFRLRCTAPNVPTRQFCSFFVKGDGDCLFASVKQLLHLDLSITEMRRQVVQYIQNTLVNVRISAVNEHLAREPSWDNERLYDDNGVEILLNADFPQVVQTDRFVHLWDRYRHDMTRHSYAGNIEIIALANIFSVNIVTWRLVDNGIATVIYSVVSEQPSTTTLHLRHNGIHFEDTNIPASFLPQRLEQRISGRERRPPRANSPD